MSLDIVEASAPELRDERVEEEPHKMASGLHGAISMLLGSYLVQHVRPNKLGHVLDSSTTFNFKDGQPKRQPDVSFVSLAKMAEPLDEELTFAPDLAVEVVSRNDALYEVEQKVMQYQRAGVGLIWVIRPFSRIVEIYHLATGLVPQIVSLTGELDGEAVLPGFKLPVKALFE